MTNRERFCSALETAYADLLANDPRYANNPLNPVELASAITNGLIAYTASKDGDGVRRACKALGIKHTYAAIRAYLAVDDKPISPEQAAILAGNAAMPDAHEVVNAGDYLDWLRYPPGFRRRDRLERLSYDVGQRDWYAAYDDRDDNGNTYASGESGTMATALDATAWLEAQRPSWTGPPAASST